MQPALASLLCVCFIIWLFRADMKWRKTSSWSLLIPGIWVVIIGSRPLPLWFYDPVFLASSMEAPSNVWIQGTLMLAAMVVLQRRAFTWGAFVRDNSALVFLYVYFAVSASWASAPEIALKRIVRDFGTVLMALMILTEPDSFGATRLLFRRGAYLLFPLSVLLIKYYPHLGKLYFKYGTTMLVGVTTHKNTLGQMVLVFGLIIVVDLIAARLSTDEVRQKTRFLLRCAMLLMGVWLILMSNSKTSFLCVMLGLTVFWMSRYLLRLRRPNLAMAACLAVVIGVAVLDSAFDVSGSIIQGLGRNATLTGRTHIWEVVREQEINPLIGCGFMAFWESPIGRGLSEVNNFEINQAHNGYLETYMNGGMVAVALLAAVLFAGAKKTIAEMMTGGLFGRTKFMFFVIALVYNWSESSFFSVVKPIWLIFLLAIIRCAPVVSVAPAARSECPVQ